MSSLDVEALLDSVAHSKENGRLSVDRDDLHRSERHDHRDRNRARDRDRDISRDRDRDRKRRDRSRDSRHKNVDADERADDLKSPRSERGNIKGRSSVRRQSRNRQHYRDSHSRPDDEHAEYRRGSAPSRTISPDGDRYYRPSARSSRDVNDWDEGRGRDRDRERERHRGGRDGRDTRDGRDGRDSRDDRDDRDVRSARSGRDGGQRESESRKSRSKSPTLNEDERDRRTVFVQQLAARLRTKELIQFFEKVGPVKEAQIVKDRVSGRSKGVGYVEFKNEDSVPLAIQLTGQKLLGIPIIAQLTEAEKNRQARNTETTVQGIGVPFHRLYVGNIHFSITESDLQNVFEPFGELEFVQLQKEEAGRSRGYGFVQFRDPTAAKEALEKMNGFDLAGRPIRVGLGNDKFTSESTQNLLQRFPAGGGPPGPFQGSSFSGSGGRGTHASGANNSNRSGGREDKGASGASALDDTDVAGVNFNNYSRDALMRKLARTDEPAETNGSNDKSRPLGKPKAEAKPLPINVPQASRCIVLRNMFDPSEEEGDSWIKELEDDVKAECEDKFGHVVHIALDPNTQGDIYVKFDRIEGGENAIRGLNGRFFGGRMITAQPVVDAVYSSLFSRNRAL